MHTLSMKRKPSCLEFQHEMQRNKMSFCVCLYIPFYSLLWSLFWLLAPEGAQRQSWRRGCSTNATQAEGIIGGRWRTCSRPPRDEERPAPGWRGMAGHRKPRNRATENKKRQEASGIWSGVRSREFAKVFLIVVFSALHSLLVAAHSWPQKNGGELPSKIVTDDEARNKRARAHTLFGHTRGVRFSRPSKFTILYI